MKKSIGKTASVFPMPVLMIATYDENGKVDVMNAAWGMNCEMDRLTLCLSSGHKTAKNLRLNKACTVALADQAHLKEADYFGMVSGNKTSDKFERTGLHTVKSEKVNAPIIEEFPIVMECELLEEVETEHLHCFVVKVLDTLAEESVLKEDGKPCMHKAGAVLFNQFRMTYMTAGQHAGNAWSEGKALL